MAQRKEHLGPHTDMKEGGKGASVQPGGSSSAFGLLLGKGLGPRVFWLWGVCASDALQSSKSAHIHSPKTSRLREKEVTHIS